MAAEYQTYAERRRVVLTDYADGRLTFEAMVQQIEATVEEQLDAVQAEDSLNG